MIDASENPPRPDAKTDLSAKVRDVADFHLRWPEFRPVALALCQSARLTGKESDTLGWMIELMDRIGRTDFDDTPT